MRAWKTIIPLAFLVVTLLAPTGCLKFGPWAKRLADKQVYPILEQKQLEALGVTSAINIDPTTSPLTLKVLANTATLEQTTTGGLKIGLADALELAVDNSWDWQRRKEDLYLSALTLTDARHDFSPIFSGAVSGQALRQPSGATGVERFGEATGDFAVTQLFATGARITVGLSQQLIRVFSRPGGDSASGALTASIVQPLLRGAGSLEVKENLTQAERNAIYQVRSFARFRKSFIIGIVNSYYRLLQLNDQIENEWQAYQRLILSRERAEALQRAERLAAFQVDQASQDEIRARNRWISARAGYANALNQFKVELGLRTDLNIQPDPAELQTLNKTGLVDIAFDLVTAEGRALESRMDYLTAQDREADNQRQLLIAENGLLPDLTARADYSLSDSGQNRPFDFRAETRRYSGQVDLELPLDRLGERNDYRRALIELERSRRDAWQLRNTILVEVRRAFQDIQEARQTYEIQLISLALAQKRVDNVQMLLDAGREGITIRDQLEAQSALRDAQNDVTRSLVDYTIARLEFYNSIEALDIDQRGMWHALDQSNS